MWQKIIEFVQNLLVPEDAKIRGLMKLEPGVMRDLLPKSPVYMKDVSVLFDYQNKIVRLIVKAIKYKNNQNLRKRIAGYFYEELIDMSAEIALFEGTPPILVPMPMSKEEKRKRGFNQCEELVREIKKLAGDPPAGGLEVSFNTLKKIKETKRQTTLSREERILNVMNSMEAENKIAKNKTVIVLDDVYTTGASLAETRRALLSAGAKRVIGLFIAH